MPGTSPFINVTDAPFGAKGDGSTDDADAIRAAIAAAAPSPSSPSGNTVYVTGTIARAIAYEDYTTVAYNG